MTSGWYLTVAPLSQISAMAGMFATHQVTIMALWHQGGTKLWCCMVQWQACLWLTKWPSWLYNIRVALNCGTTWCNDRHVCDSSRRVSWLYQGGTNLQHHLVKLVQWQVYLWLTKWPSCLYDIRASWLYDIRVALNCGTAWCNDRHVCDSLSDHHDCMTSGWH